MPSGQPGASTRIAIAALLVLAALAVYARTVGYPFLNYDDEAYVTQNPGVASGLDLRSIGWALMTLHAANWHPLTWISHALDVTLFGMRPGGHHGTNVLLHAANAALLFLVLVRATGEFWRAAWVAGVFALHPLNVESVAWVAQRKGLLSAFFALLAIGAYLRYVEAPSARRYTLVALLFALGLAAKPMLVTLPFVLLLLDFWPLQRLGRDAGGASGWRSRGKSGTSSGPAPPGGRGPVPLGSITGGSTARALIVEKVPLIVLSAASSVVTYVAQSRGGAVTDFETLPLPARLAQAIVAYASYLGKALWPVSLAVIVPHRPSGAPLWPVLASGLVLGAVTASAILWRRSAPFLLVGWLWYLGTLVPVIGLVQVGSQASADRYAYLPLIGLCIVVAWGCAEILDRLTSGRARPAVSSAAPEERARAAGGAGRTATVRDPGDRTSDAGPHDRRAAASWPRLAGVAAGVLSLAALAALSWRQIGFWRSSTALFTHAIEVSRDNYIAQNYLGLALAKERRTAEAAEHFREAIRIWPGYGKAHSNLGLALTEQGALDEALEHHRLAVRLVPGYALGHNNLGIVLARTGLVDEAIAQFQEALRLDPSSPHARRNLGTAMLQRGNPGAAAEQLEIAVRDDPDDPIANYSLGRALLLLGRPADAIPRLREAVRLDPKLAPAKRSLDEALERAGRERPPPERPSRPGPGSAQ